MLHFFPKGKSLKAHGWCGTWCAFSCQEMPACTSVCLMEMGAGSCVSVVLVEP